LTKALLIISYDNIYIVKKCIIRSNIIIANRHQFTG
jgi:hypothetical protein